MINNLNQNTEMAKWKWWLSLFTVALIAGCQPAADPCSAPPMDVVFNACAFVDTNGNSLLDYEQDSPLEGATLTFVKVSGEQWVEYTGADGCAMVSYAIYCRNPSDFPMKLRMAPPDEGGYVSIGPTEVEVSCCGGGATFLFSLSDTTPSPTLTVTS